MTASLARKARKVVPKILAVIHADGCTGCEACLEICPVGCIFKVAGEDHPGLQAFCDIDIDRCIGCQHCRQICPRDAVEMVPTPEVARHVAAKGGPPRYVDESGDALVDQARRNAEEYLAKKHP